MTGSKSEFLTDEDVEKIEELANKKDIQGIIDIFDSFINYLYGEMPDCDSCDERRGDSRFNEGYL